MTDYRNHLAQHMRLALLRLLADAPGYAVNDSLAGSALRQCGFHASRDQVRSELAWLAEQGLCRLEDVGGLTVATLSERGRDVAEGRATVPGVQRPSPD